MRALLCEAIRNRRVIAFSYDGGLRKAEPFSYGRNTRGNDVLCAYQIGGYSASGSPRGWKCYKVDKIDACTITEERFSAAREDYNPNDPKMVQVYCRV